MSRRMQHETLEKRELLAAELMAHPIFAPGTSDEVIQELESRMHVGGSTNGILAGSRWSIPASGPSPNTGDPVTLTWGIVPDGTQIIEPNTAAVAGTSNVVAFMDGIYGGSGINVISSKPWFPLFQRIYDMWSEQTGITLVYEANDDGAPLAEATAATTGVLGVRADMRIGGMNIDGNSNILAFNYFPAAGGAIGVSGDMVIDTNDNFYSLNADGPTGPNTALTNVLAHEVGHGLGIAHVEPINQTKLLEPFVTTAFYGPQEDDIWNAHILYGDPLEPNDSLATANDFGVLSDELRTVNQASIDNFSTDVDLYEFAVTSPANISVDISPTGTQYLAGPQNGTPVPVNRGAQVNLGFRVLDSSGAELLRVDDTGLGQGESTSDFGLTSAGTYFVEVFGVSGIEAQLYSMDLRVGQTLGTAANTGALRLVSVNPNADDIFSQTDLNRLETSPTELTLRFSADTGIDPATLSSGIGFREAGRDGVLQTADDIVVTPAWIGFGDSDRVVIARFGERLPDGLYRVEVYGEGIKEIVNTNADTLRKLNGDAFQPRENGSDRDTIDFALELGARVSAVVPQPVVANADGSVTPQRDVIHVYFDDNDLFAGGGTDSLKDPAFYQLIRTGDTVQNTDDIAYLPDSVNVTVTEPQAVPDPSNPGSTINIDVRVNRVELTFSSDLAALVGTGAYRLKIGSKEAVTVAGDPSDITTVTPGADPGDTVGTALPLTAFGSTSTLMINGSIVGPGLPFDLPGVDGQLGAQDVGEQQHIGGADGTAGITQRSFNFALNRPYATLPDGRQLFTSINPDQMDRIREIYDYFGEQLGVDFVETESSGTTVVVGELIGFPSGPGGTLGAANSALAVMDAAENWYDGPGRSNTGQFSFFETAIHELGHSIGLGHTYDLHPTTVMGSETQYGGDSEWNFPGPADLIHGRTLYRPDNRDVDFYSFNIAAGKRGFLDVETFAERTAVGSLLDTQIALYRQTASGPELIAANNDSFGSDSALSVELEAGNYFIGVTADGNENYDPDIAGSGAGADSSGTYQLRVKFTEATGQSILDAAGTPIDGDADGVPGGEFDFWFRADDLADTLYVNAAAPIGGDGSAATPFRSVADALAAAAPGQTVRLVGNTGADGSIGVVSDGFQAADDNLSFNIGRINSLSQTLKDGRNLVVPAGVNLMIDAGVVMKMLGSRIAIGSGVDGIDASEGTLQVLGVPHLPVFFTSFNDPGVGLEQSSLSLPPSPGDWGGIDIRNGVDRSEGRVDFEREGLFINYIANANMRYGGGLVQINGQPTTVEPIRLDAARPTLIGNEIYFSSSAAISADPPSFEETKFTGLLYQRDHSFVPDYDRIGPVMYGNDLVDNSINGVLVRIDATANGKESLRVAGRFDDTEVVHVLGDDLVIEGYASGAKSQTQATSPQLTTLTPVAASGAGLAAGNYEYAISFVDNYGFESLLSNPTVPVTVAAGQAVQLGALPIANGDYVSRRLYRRNTASGGFQLVAELDRTDTTHLDDVTTATTAQAFSQYRTRLDARLIVDPGLTVKSTNVRIELGFGADLIAEGVEGRPVIFTSRSDDRYGAGGTFDTTDNGDSTGTAGDWAGIYSRPFSRLSLDNTLVGFAGGTSSINGTSSGFNAIEIRQSDARIANTVFESNASGVAGIDPFRAGRGPNAPAVIYVSGSQPTILDNVIKGTVGLNTAAISINLNALDATPVVDGGRQTGDIGIVDSPAGNFGPLIHGNLLEANGIAGLRIRPELAATEIVWDDTDIVHVVSGTITDTNLHTYGGIRLQSRVDESLVVKFLQGNSTLVADGRATDILDRVGGTLHVIGQPEHPVILTSIDDDSVGAGFDPFGEPLVDTGGNGLTQPLSGSWRGLQLNEYSNDRNVETVIEREGNSAGDGDLNATPDLAETLGTLAKDEKSSDEISRLGFTVHGTIASPGDQDVYSFRGTAGTTVWLDIDRTASTLDSVIELVQADGTVLARSDNSHQEAINGVINFPGTAGLPMQQSTYAPTNLINGTYQDLYTTNPMDAGMRVVLPGAVGSSREYFVRVSGANGSVGLYQMQARLREADEFGGSTVRYSDIRYAQIGIDVNGLPSHSLLTGEGGLSAPANAIVPVNLGSIASSDRAAISVSGNLTGGGAINRYQFQLERDSIQGQQDTVQGVGGTTNDAGDETYIAATFDIDYGDGFSRPDTTLLLYWLGVDGTSPARLIMMGTNSNVMVDRANPLEGTDITDLDRGSAGHRDAFLGTVELRAGFYEVAVIGDAQIPADLRQSFNADPANPDVRLEPVTSVIRIAEDRFADNNLAPLVTAAAPIQVVFQGEQNAVPFQLGDVDLLVLDSDAANTSYVGGANPLIGSLDAIYTNNVSALGDIAVHPGGVVYASSGARGDRVETDANTEPFFSIDETGRNVVNVGNTGLQTFEGFINNGNPAVGRAIINGNRVGHGMVFNALSYQVIGGGNSTLNLYGVAGRGNGQMTYTGATINAQNQITGLVPGLPAQNYLYRLNPTTGAAINATANGAGRTGNGTARGAGTNTVEVGHIGIQGANPGDPDVDIGLVTGITDVGGTLYVVTDNGSLLSIPPNQQGNGSVANVRYIGNMITQFPGINFTSLTTGPKNLPQYANLLFATDSTGMLHLFDTTGAPQELLDLGQSTIQMPSSTPNGIAFSTLDINLWHQTQQRGGDDGHGAPATEDLVRPDTAGQSSLYFGYETPAGNNTQAGTWTGQNLATRSLNSYDFAGGAHGQIQSFGFDLSEYGAMDEPVMYFSYFADTQDAEATIPSSANALDSVRVYVSSEQDRGWRLVATNNGASAGTQNDGQDEFDVGESRYIDPSGDPHLTRELFDRADWRQARVDLSPWAGQSDVRIRFDFNTAGESQVDVVELGAVRPQLLLEGDGTNPADRNFTLIHDSTANATTFEFDFGLVLQPTSGQAINHNDTFTLTNPFSAPVTFRYVDLAVAAPANSRDIGFNKSDTAATISNNTRAALQANGFTTILDPTTPNRFGVPGNNPTIGGVQFNPSNPLISSFAIDLAGVQTFGAIPIPISVNSTTGQIATTMQTVIATQYHAGLGPVSLAPYQLYGTAGNESVRMYGFTLLDAGSLIYFQNDETSTTTPGAPGQRAGAYSGSAVAGLSRNVLNTRGRRAENNAFEGFFIDDVIIGFAERGELVLDANPGIATADNPYHTPSFLPGGATPSVVDAGPFQLEVRLSAEYAIPGAVGPGLTQPVRSYDTNDIIGEGISLQLTGLHGSQIVDGSFVSLSDGLKTLRFEFNNLDDGVGTAPTTGAIPVPYNSQSTDVELATALRDAINQPFVQDSFLVSAASPDGRVTTGIGFSDTVFLQGPAAADILGGLNFAPTIPGLTFVQHGVEFFGPDSQGSIVPYGPDNGDSNRYRDQGQVILQNNVIVDSSTFGISVDAGRRNRDDVSTLGSNDLPRPGTVRAFPTLNQNQTAPGVVIVNNILADNAFAGISLVGDAQTGAVPAPSPFARVVNNTIVGGNVGIDVSINAAPTLVNNAVVGNAIGVRADGSINDIELFAMLYSGNAQPTQNVGAGGFAVFVPTGDPLFVDQANRNFYPAAGSLLIDNATGLVDERFDLANLRGALGIAESPIFAPFTDLAGQRRSDTSGNNNGSGTGPSVFVDIGALDRVDNFGPIAELTDPLDNGADGRDIDGFATYVRLASGTQGQFLIQLRDTDGTGLDDNTVLEQAIVLTENGRRLIPGTDFTYAYSATTNTIALTPAGGVWDPSSAYEITLNNRDRVVVSVSDGLGVQDGEQFTIQDDSGNLATFEYDSGYVLQVAQTLSLQVVSDVSGFLDQQTFSITSPDGLTEIFFEFDKLGGVTSPNIPIDITSPNPLNPQVSASDVRDAILAALSDPAIKAALSIDPIAVGADRIQLGSQAGAVVTEALNGLLVDGVDQGIAVGDYFLYASSDGITRQFEFVDASNPVKTLLPTTDVIPLNGTETPEQIADLIGSAVRASGLDLAARGLEDGRVYFGGMQGDTIDIQSGGLSIIGTPAVTGKLMMTVPSAATGATVSGEQVTVTIGNNTRTFLLTTNSSVVTSDRIVLLLPTADATVIAQTLAAAIDSEFAATSTTSTNNVIALGEPNFSQGSASPINSSVDVSSSSLTTTGVAGGVIRVPFIPSAIDYPANTLAAEIISAIERSGLTTTTFAPGGGTIWLDNTTAVTGPQNGVVRSIRDLAGNPLQANRVNRETQFTILMPGVELDFGDAPSRLTTIPGYLTLLAENGARHTVSPAGGPSLGDASDSRRNIDTETDAFAFPLSDDTASVISAVATGAGSFTINNVVLGEELDITVDTAAGAAGDILSITIDGSARTYELISAGNTTFASDVGIIRVPGEPSSVLAQRVAAAVSADLKVNAIRTSVLYTGNSASFSVSTFNDEDGVGISSGSGGVPAGVFVDPDSGQVISFLNPLDSSGAEVIVETTGGGLLDAWIDFNGDGDFLDPNEQVLRNQVVLDGENTVTILTPTSPAVLAGGLTGSTWARFRISSTGNLTPSGVAIGGEVEDYPVFIASAVLPVPTGATCVTPDNSCTIAEAPEMPVSGDELNGVVSGTFSVASPIAVQYELERGPSNAAAIGFGASGTGFDLDPNTGGFSYLPRDDFYGQDFFTYRVIETQTIEGVTLPVRSSVVATVTINVTPVNDPPVAEDKLDFITTEPTDTNTSTAVTITKAELLTNALPMSDTATQLPPWNESEQTLTVQSISVVDASGNIVVAAAGVPTETYVSDGAGGFVVAGTVTTTELNGEVLSVVFQPDADYNENNPSDGANGSRATFYYTVTDDGMTTLPNGNPAVPMPAPETVQRQIQVRVLPMNDPPTSSFVPIVIDSSTLGATLQEDTDFVIPESYLLSFASPGTTAGDDEDNPVNGNVFLVEQQGLTTAVPIGPVNAGIAVHDTATGTGYIMHSQTSVFTRFAASPPPMTSLGLNSQNMVAVRFFFGSWQYSNDTTWINFTPDPTDRLIADVDFDANTISGLLYAFGSVNGIEQGYVDSDLTFISNRFNGLNDDGEFTIQGTQFLISAEPNFPPQFRPFPLTTTNGGTVSFDTNTRELTYSPPADYYGPDSFTYFVADEGIDVVLDANGDPVLDINGDPVTVVNIKYAPGTVSLDIAPVNDPPFAPDQSFVTDEDTVITITAAELVAGVQGDAMVNPDFDFFPFNESNQNPSVINPNAAFVTKLAISDGILTTEVSALAPPALTDEFPTTNGTITNIQFDVSGNLISLDYRPDQDFNSQDPTGGTNSRLDGFGFTVSDDGRSFYNGAFVQGTPLTMDANAEIYVRAMNDAPLPGDDLITSDPTGAWMTFFASAPPTPQEDRTLLIPTAFVLRNDENSRATAIDERANVTDSANLTLVPTSITTALGGTVQLTANGLVYTPPANVYGLDTFEYRVRDNGVDELALSPSQPFGNLQLNPAESNGTISILLDPVNDRPEAFDRSLSGVEDNTITFDVNDLLNLTGSTPALPSDATPQPNAPYNEVEQTLRIVGFADGDESVDVNDLIDPLTNNDGDGTLTMTTVSGGTLSFTFVDGAFTTGVYTPADDYNRRTPFAAVEVFTYIVADDGLTVVPGSGIVDGSLIDSQVDLVDQRSVPATVTISVAPENDAPTFAFNPVVNVLERDDNGETLVPGWATSISPGPPSALDELQRESVVFSIVTSESIIPAGLFWKDPLISSNGSISVFPAPDQFGSAEIVVDVMDADPFDPTFVPIQSRITFQLNVQPVNDPPRLESSLAGTSDSASPDEAYTIANDGTLTYVLKEDNTQAGGTVQPFELFARNTTPVTDPYRQPGLLDVFNAGPANEVGNFSGGSQILRITGFPATTALGGTLQPVTDINGDVVSLLYTPPVDRNTNINAIDSFTYQVTDDSPLGGETYSLFGQGLIDDRRSVTNRVQLVLNPVNDRPSFDTVSLNLEVAEDASVQRSTGFAFNISAGPIGTATDETNITTGQTLTFDVNPLSYAIANQSDFFVSPPSLSTTGVLTYQPAEDVFGRFEFEIILRDSGASDLARGDLNESVPVTLTIDVLPSNDAPELRAGVSPLAFSVQEDMPIDFSVAGGLAAGDLLGSYNVGAVNEAANLAPAPGGNQTLSLGPNFPTTTSQGGTLTPILDSNNLVTGYQYQPPVDFVGTDSFVYSVVDDGQSVALGTGGVGFDDARTTMVTVPITVTPVNDAPLFSGGNDVFVDEGAGEVTLVDWMVGLAVGPSTANDELNGTFTSSPQTLSLSLNIISGGGLFDVGGSPTITLDGDAATLQFTALPDANGIAVVDVILSDSGPNSAPNGDVNSIVHRFEINVAAINDAPTFTPGADIVVDEDSGAYSSVNPWATNISPGPAEEATTQTVTGFEVLSPVGSPSLFSVPPAIDANGFLTFTLAPDASGVVDLDVTAIDSLGGRSNTVTLNVTINGTDDPPTPMDDVLTTDEDTVVRIQASELLANDGDPDLPADVLTVVLNSQFTTTLGATATYNSITGEIVYDPTTSATLKAMGPNETMVDSFTYAVVDANGEVPAPTAQVSITVTGINDAPDVGDDTFDVAPDTTTLLLPLLNDSDSDGSIDPATVIITTQPTSGALVNNGDGTLSYTPATGFRGTVQFQYTVADLAGQQSQQGNVTLRVGLAPEAVNDLLGTSVDVAVELDVLANDIGQPDPTKITVVTQPTNGVATVLPNGTIRYTPNLGFTGTDSLEYSVADVTGFESNTATVDLVVVQSTLQNPIAFNDVNASGEVTALDALIIVNRLRLNDDRPNPILVSPTDRGPDYYDVNGDGKITALDALLVVNEIARLRGLEPEGEFVTVNTLSDQIEAPTPAVIEGYPIDQIETLQSVTDRIVATSTMSRVDVELIDVISDSSDRDEDAESKAIDEALIDFEL
ncbi:tandem-95 repeat protein [Stieleria varia]|uniref:Matrixin n=1 Tax=Stieleria varia TaxID=2528005 RepID=A0A5C6B3C6_9BACT|nr:Ig-like domain-containing protein [Stieleria varia]TWU06032.1 Matrixin [Stieleria varia]